MKSGGKCNAIAETQHMNLTENQRSTKISWTLSHKNKKKLKHVLEDFVKIDRYINHRLR